MIKWIVLIPLLTKFENAAIRLSVVWATISALNTTYAVVGLAGIAAGVIAGFPDGEGVVGWFILFSIGQLLVG